MSLADIFSTPFLMCLGICLLLIGLVGMYLTQKLSDQDHKISSMMGLVSTMAEELNYVRGVVQGGIVPISRNHNPDSNDAQLLKTTSQKNDDLIEVSDGDNSDSDSDSDGDSDSDSDSEDSGSDNEDSDVDNLAELNFEQHANNEMLSDILNIKPPDIKTIHMMNGSLNINYGEDVDDEENIELVSDDEEEEEDDDSSSSSENDETPLLSNIDIALEEVVHLDADPIKINPAEKVDSNSDSNLNPLEEVELKQIIVNLDLNIAEYKKMSLNQLRAISVKKGLLTEANAGKLKKPELVKLLEQ